MKLLTAVVVSLLIVGGAAYAFRDRLAEVWTIGNPFTSGATGTAGPEGTATGAPLPRPMAETVDPRGEVNLDLRRQQLIGVRTAPVERSPASRTVRTVGVVRYDETRLADVNLKIGGWIRDLYVDYTGKAVRQGDPLFSIYSPDLLATMQEYLLALKTRDQMQASQVADAREYADRLVEAARRRIELWDLPADQMRALEESRQPQTNVTFRSPVTGYVIEKQVLKGMHVEPGQTLYRIADLSTVWLEADVYEQEMSVVRVGQAATVTLDAYPDDRVNGRVVYIYPFVEENTRTVKVRFQLPNRAGRLRPGMYANVALEAPLGMSTTIPANALLDSGSRQLVFVAEGGGYFRPRDVRVGQRLGERVQILDGLNEGEQVALGATFFLDSESQLRAAVQAFEPARGAAAPSDAGERLDITFRSQPDPPRMGDNTLEVSVRDASGQPVPDADVSVTFFMAAMPTMNMPAMRSEAKLPPAGGGVYRGAGQVMMAGRWDVTVTVTRGEQRLGSEQFSLVAK
ncbi:MAG: FixH family protein [Acidobacteria bacterium]|nr:FixH family protein [Acidobacteriota bacterium]